MKRFLFVFFITLPILSSGALAGNKWIYSDGCMITRTPSPDWIAWCGSAKEKCDGTRAKYRKQTLVGNGQLWSVSHNGDGNYVWYACCDGQFKTVDTSKYSNKGGDLSAPTLTQTKTITLDGGGKCTYQAKYNACGKEITTPCTAPTDCTDGLIKRNNVCIEPCAEGFAFESAKSNKCIECPTTTHSGPKTVKENGKITDTYCLKCDADTEIFDKETDTCIKKSEMIVISPEIMAKCGLCDNNETVKKCIKCFAGIGEYKGKTETECKTTFKDNCLFPD